MDHFWVETVRVNVYFTFVSSSAMTVTMLQTVAVPLDWALHWGYHDKVDTQHEWKINVCEATPSAAPNGTKNDVQMPYHAKQVPI